MYFLPDPHVVDFPILSILLVFIVLSVFWVVSKPLTYMKKIDNNLIDAYTTEMKESG